MESSLNSEVSLTLLFKLVENFLAILMLSNINSLGTPSISSINWLRAETKASLPEFLRTYTLLKLLYGKENTAKYTLVVLILSPIWSWILPQSNSTASPGVWKQAQSQAMSLGYQVPSQTKA